jgi:thiol-disulfide isomerase/thioredoxin
MPISKKEFTRLENEISRTGKSALDCLASNVGKVYVVSITRDGCSACKRQKPKLTKLAIKMAGKYEDRVSCVQVHIRQPPGDIAESLRAKDILGHYFYPTNLILLRTRDRGAIEYYRNVSPEMDELEKNIESALETARMIEKETD